MGRETNLETSLGGKPAHHQKAIPTAHLTLIIDSAHGKQPSCTHPQGCPRAPSSNLGPVTPPKKTYVLFCEESQPLMTPEAPLGGRHLAQARAPCHPAKGLWPQLSPQTTGSPLKTVPVRSSAWKTVTGSLKALSSSVCGQAG